MADHRFKQPGRTMHPRNIIVRFEKYKTKRSGMAGVWVYTKALIRMTTMRLVRWADICVPSALLEGAWDGFGRICMGGPGKSLSVNCHRLAILPSHIIQRGADQVHHTGQPRAWLQPAQSMARRFPPTVTLPYSAGNRTQPASRYGHTVATHI